MVYEWKVAGVMKVDAQTAGEEFERIYEKNGRLDPADVVEESRPESAPLHKCFEWRDDVAAEMYRKTQASQMIRCITTVVETPKEEPVVVRAFPCTGDKYEPITRVLKSEDSTAFMLKCARSELQSFKRKYAALAELSGVIKSIDDFMEEEHE